MRSTPASSNATERGDYSGAERAARHAIDHAERHFDEGSAETATPANNLAEVSRAPGRHAQSESLHERALTIHERSLGPDHPDTALVRENLAQMRAERGR